MCSDNRPMNGLTALMLIFLVLCLVVAVAAALSRSTRQADVTRTGANLDSGGLPFFLTDAGHTSGGGDCGSGGDGG